MNSPAFNRKSVRLEREPRIAGDPTGSPFAWLRALGALLGRAYRAHCAEDQLADLDERLLRDIGLTRREVRSAVWGRKLADSGGVRLPDEPRPR
ncbi:DUF1127 domain-containing protein [Algihabitans albus]|uniref:DUF1127 domain-containing protein n=1 Tax=Algihabitans albus TaxID=2164067 RepID=UPI000E5D44A0